MLSLLLGLVVYVHANAKVQVQVQVNVQLKLKFENNVMVTARSTVDDKVIFQC